MSTIAIDPASAKPRDGRAARVTTIVIAGLLGALYAYYQWRGPLGVSLEFSVSVHMNDDSTPMRPWAPWWIPIGIVAALSMLLWRRLALRRGISAIGGMVAFMAVELVTLPVLFLCLSLGLLPQYYPSPSILRVLTSLPAMVLQAVATTIMIGMMGAFFHMPVLALIAALNAGIGKLILRVGRRRRRQSVP
jgi:hypothetical protein